MLTAKWKDSSAETASNTRGGSAAFPRVHNGQSTLLQAEDQEGEEVWGCQLEASWCLSYSGMITFLTASDDGL